jgi:hypothetical protein
MIKPQSKLKTFHATMQVVRTEEWCVEAETPEEARVLLAVGQGHRCSVGECLSAELQDLHPDESPASGIRPRS